MAPETDAAGPFAAGSSPDAAPVRLRGHHLLCLLTYVGHGYTPAFTANYDRLVARLNAGAPAELVEGPDDLCAPMLACGHHCRNDSVTARDAAARAALAPLLGPLMSGERLHLSADRLAGLRAAFAAGSIRAACGGCEWAGLCTTIAEGGFRRVRLVGADTFSLPGGCRSPG